MKLTKRDLVVDTLVLLVFAIPLGVAINQLLQGCDRQVIPKLSTVSTATASTEAKGSQDAEVIAEIPFGFFDHSQPAGAGAGLKPSAGINTPTPPPIRLILRASQSMAVSGSSSAAVITPAPMATPGASRLGVVVASMPGALAVDFEAVKLEPSWLPVPVGLDAVANLQAAGVGVSAGDQLFATGGAWITYNGSDRGLYAGVGLRFR